MEQVLQAIETTKEQVRQLILLERMLTVVKFVPNHPYSPPEVEDAKKRYAKLSLSIFGTVIQDNHDAVPKILTSVPTIS